MNIAIIMCGHAVEPGGGVRMQGIMWRDGLRALGHNVDLVCFWNKNNWLQYDAIIIMQMVGQFKDIIRLVSKNNGNVFFAPILDPGPDASIRRYRFLSKTMQLVCSLPIIRKFHLSSSFTDFYEIRAIPKSFIVRSNQEAEYVNRCFDVSPDNVHIVPLSLRFIPSKINLQKKDNFCLHVSRLSAPNKNVPRLIEASKKYGFYLVLAGYLHGEEEKDWLRNLIGSAKNIEYVGTLSEDSLKEYYRQAKVFALPSYSEGVGMVAMEAAAYGCEVVLTNRGAPKDYYNGLAKLVDPFSVDEIGRGIMECLISGYSQPRLQQYISTEYSLISCSKKLEAVIQSNIL